MSRPPGLCCAFLLSALNASVALADAAPAEGTRLEFGIGAVVLTVPDYRGSNRSDVQTYPFPYVVYRSEHVQVTRGGLRAKVFSLDQLSLTISGALNLTTRRDNPDRAGMPRLSPTFEIGPALDYRVEEGEHWSLRARLPVRGAVSTGGFRWVGLVLDPHLRLDLDQKLTRSVLYYGATLGALVASADYHRYYYGVEAQYATPARPAYAARGGYSGLHASVSAAWRVGRWRLGAFAYDDWLDGVAFEDSPLFKTRNNFGGGALLTYRLYSRGRVYDDQDADD